MRYPLSLALVAIALCVNPLFAATPSSDRPNVLFIAVDDLRPQLGCYGKSHMHSPNIDRLASSGVLFERAYCMVPTCGASRASLMSGIRPTRQRFTSYLTWAEKDAADAVPLHTCFQQAGYQTVSLGKVFHHRQDHVNGWTQKPWRSAKNGYFDVEAQKRDIRQHRQEWPQKKKHRGAPYEAAVAHDEDYPDGDCAHEAIKYLQQFSQDRQQPFFLAVGFLKPHLPFNAPQKYWDLYDFDEIDLPPNYHPPEDAPNGAVHSSGELRAYAEIPAKGPVDRETARKLIHGYYACVSFTDAQVGKLLDAVDELGLAENTIVVLWGDHGWQLGEHGMWNKHSCFETSMHAPLIIRAPHGDPSNSKIQPGTRVTSLVEFIDIYPSLCQLAGIAPPAHLEGESLVPSMIDPGLPGKPFAVGRFGAGDTIRSPQYRYSRYTDRTGQLTGEMLYDHEQDPDENRNISAKERGTATELSSELAKRKGR